MIGVDCGRRSSLLNWLGLVVVIACAKERPFATGASPLQPDVDMADGSGTDAAVQNPRLAEECGIDCPEPLTCDSSSRRCVECLTSNDCLSSDAPLCDAMTKACVECLVNADCPSDSPICKAEDGRCIQCMSDAQCPEVAPACDPNTNECTSRCTNSTQCTPATPVCNEQAQICVGCLTDADCAGILTVCDVGTYGCVECLDDSGCDDGRACNEAHTCVDCRDNSQCLDPFKAHCQLSASAGEARFKCVGCVEDRDCAGKPGLGGLCRPDDAKCVECLSDAECVDNPAESNCSSEGVCAACVVDADCSLIQGRPSCLPNVGCVECVDASDCMGFGERPVCKTSNSGQSTGSAPIDTCVECADNTDCVAVGASRCENNECVPCLSNSDCAHVQSPNALSGSLLQVCDAGVCVECTGLQRAACGANVCDSISKQCSAFPAASAKLCEPCLSDDHCEATARCVLQTFGASTVGHYCFPVATGNPANCDDNLAFVSPTLARTIDTPSASVCLQRLTTCPAYLDYVSGGACEGESDDASCGGVDLGGSCALGPQGFRCTVSCIGRGDCSGGACINGLCEL